MYVWPHRLLPALTQKTQLRGQVLTGGQGLSGQVQTTRMDGGGFWMTDLTGIWLRRPDQVRALRAWSAHLDGGSTEVIVPLPDLAFAPRPYQGGTLGLPGKPGPVDDYFGQEPGFGSPLMVATCTAAALRATSLSILMTRGQLLKGGEHFSLNHTTKGWRVYRIARVTPGGVEGASQTVQIRPPLREAVAAGTTVEFDVPRCVMRLMPDQAEALEPEIFQRRATVEAHFVESF